VYIRICIAAASTTTTTATTTTTTSSSSSSQSVGLDTTATASSVTAASVAALGSVAAAAGAPIAAAAATAAAAAVGERSQFEKEVGRFETAYNRKTQEQHEYTAQLATSKTRARPNHFEYENTPLFLLLMLQATVKKLVPRTCVHLVHYTPETKELRLRLCPEACTMTRIRNLKDRPEFVPGSVYVTDATINLQLMGIEAAATSFHLEVQKSMAPLGKLRSSHYSLFAQAISWTGKLVPTSREGYKQSEPNPYARAMFEQNGKNIMKLTCGKKSTNAGPYWDILSGRAPPYGSHYYKFSH
jgi:hypothetical protein